tara:strand:- start:8881 stop:9540 length:660 start_codon:yes stop_codon:yes gene_type:complete
MNVIRTKITQDGERNFYVDGEGVSKCVTSLDFVVLGAAPVARTYWGGGYRHKGAHRPKCGSLDTVRPHPASLVKQATRCIDCPQNIQGSGVGNTKACKFSQTLAVSPPPFDEPFHFKVYGVSLFIKSGEGEFNLRGYTKYLNENGERSDSILTHAFFTQRRRTSGVVFKPVRPLTEDEREAVDKLQTHETTEHIIASKTHADSVGSRFGVEDGFIFNLT